MATVSYEHIEDPQKLRRLLDAVLLLEADLSLPVLLRHFVEEACAMTGARYGALGVLNSDRTELAEFITVGLSDDEERRIGAPPAGLGVLGHLITDPAVLRLANISDHSERAGFPPGHPPMTSFLGIPVSAHDEVYGNLYLTDKTEGLEFTPDDEALVRAFSQAAALAIENARLHERVQELALLEDRNRIARDLHDAVIQRLFAVGLSLQGVARPPVPDHVVERLERAIADIDDTIRQVRSSIFELSSASTSSGLRSRILGLVRELRQVVGFDPAVSFDGPVDTSIPDDVAEHLLFTLREALTNIGRHAHASHAEVSVRVSGASLTLEVSDDGRGMAAASEGGPEQGGLGLLNLRTRAEKLGGDVLVESPPGGGTSVLWRVPVPG